MLIIITMIMCKWINTVYLKIALKRLAMEKAQNINAQSSQELGCEVRLCLLVKEVVVKVLKEEFENLMRNKRLAMEEEQEGIPLA